MGVVCKMRYNGLGLCEVAENRSGKFRFRRNVAKANFYLLNYEKKPIKLAFAEYEAQTFNLDGTRHFAKPLLVAVFYLQFFISLIKFIISGILIFAFIELSNAISAYFCAFGQSFCSFIINPRFK